MKASIILFISIFFVTTPSVDESFFWGQNGHRVTGEIATKHLTKRAKRKIDKLLKGQSLAFVSTFADQIKSDRKYSAVFCVALCQFGRWMEVMKRQRKIRMEIWLLLLQHVFRY